MLKCNGLSKSFEKVLFSGFRERRKQIKKRLNIETISWDDTCEMLDINITARSEELSIDQWIGMARLHDKNPLKAFQKNICHY